jgi:hypothetical protein
MDVYEKSHPMKRPTLYLTLPSLLGLSLALALLGLLNQPTHEIASAAPLQTTLIVTTTIQAAIDAAQPGDMIFIPAGTYTESLTLSKAVSLTGESAPTTIISAQPNDRVLTVTGASINQTVIISGLTFANGNILTGVGEGGGLWIGNQAQPLLQNLIFTNCTASERGGGLYADGSSPLKLINVSFISNTAGAGGGLLGNALVTLMGGAFKNNRAEAAGGLSAGELILTGTSFVNNTAQNNGGAYVWFTASIAEGYFEGNHSTNSGYHGGGLFVLNLHGAPNALTMTGTTFVSNTSALDGGGAFVAGVGRTIVIDGYFENNGAEGEGGGLMVYGPLTLTGTEFISNTAAGWGGGGAYFLGKATVQGGRFENNQATSKDGSGGGLYSEMGLTLTGTQFINNTARWGGGAHIYSGPNRLVNTLFARNTAEHGSAALLFNNTAIIHATIVSPTVSAGSALYIESGLAEITNTVISSYTIGIEAGQGSAHQDYNVIFAAIPTSGSVSGNGYSLIGLDPAFIDPQHDDYHLSAHSPTIDVGINAGISVDLDGHLRPQGAGYDIGAYESPDTRYKVYLPHVMHDSP